MLTTYFLFLGQLAEQKCQEIKNKLLFHVAQPVYKTQGHSANLLYIYVFTKL